MTNRFYAKCCIAVFVLLLFIIPVSGTTYLMAENGSTIQDSNYSIASVTSSSYTSLLPLNNTLNQNISGWFTVKYYYRYGSGSGAKKFKLYKNGIAFGDEYSSGTTDYALANQTFFGKINDSDVISVYAKYDDGGSGSAFATNITLEFNYTPAPVITSPANNSAQTGRALNVSYTYNGTGSVLGEFSTVSDFSTKICSQLNTTGWSNCTVPMGLIYVRLQGNDTANNSETNLTPTYQFGIYSNIVQFGRSGYSWQNNVTHDDTRYVNATDDIRLNHSVSDWIHYYPFDTNQDTGTVFPSYVYDENSTSASILTRYGYPKTITTVVGQGVVMNNASYTGNSTGDYFVSNNNYNYSNMTVQMSFKAFNFTNPSLMYISRAGNWRLYLITTVGNPYYGKLLFISQRNTTDGNWVANSTVLAPGTRYNVSVSYNNLDVANDPVIFINANNESIVETSTPVAGVKTDRSDTYFGRTPAGTLDCDCQFDETYIFDRNLEAQERTHLSENAHLSIGNFSIQHVNFNTNKSLFIQYNGSIPSGASVDLYYNGSNNSILWTGYTLFQESAINSILYSIPNYGNVSVRAVLHNTSGYSQSPVIINFSIFGGNETPAPNQVVGVSNSTVTRPEYTMNITWTANTDPFMWEYEVFRNGSHIGYTYNNYYFDYYPLLNMSTNYSYQVRARNAVNSTWGENSSYHNVSTTGITPYIGTPSTNLNRLIRPTQNITQYFYPDNTNFFFFDSDGGTNWTINVTERSATSGGSGIFSHPMEFYLKPDVDGIININTQKYASNEVITIWVNSQIYGAYNLSGSTDLTTIVLSGLNQSRINEIKIGSLNTSLFKLYSIKYNRTLPTLSTNVSYFQIRKAAYMGQINDSTDYGRLAYMWNYLDLPKSKVEFSDMKDLNFTMVSIPLVWGSFVKDVRAIDGVSYNEYNYSNILKLDQIIDNASSEGLYTFMWFNAWIVPTGVAAQSGNLGCVSCLVNATNRDSIIQLMTFLSNRYKNHTSLMWDFPFEGMDIQYSNPLFYNNVENVASWEAYSGYTATDNHLPFTSVNDSYERCISEVRWSYDRFTSISDIIIGIVHNNGQLITHNSFVQYPVCDYGVRETSRIFNYTAPYDFVGAAIYPNKDVNMDSINATNWRWASILKAFGSIPYWAEFGLNTDTANWTYLEPTQDIINVVLGKSLTSTIPSIDYDNKNLSYAMGGYSYWRWQEGGSCTRLPGGTVLDECWGLKYANGSYTDWAALIGYLNIQDIVKPESISNPLVVIENNQYNLSWSPATDADMNYVLFKYSNGTEYIQILNGTNYFISNITSGLNVSAQTVDLWGNTNDTLIWFNASDQIIPESVTNATATANYTHVLMNWSNPLDADFSHVCFQNNGTGACSNLTNTSWNISGTAGQTFNYSAQTCDIVGNCNATKIWFNATIQVSDIAAGIVQSIRQIPYKLYVKLQ